jgi:hypothetical protein
MNRKIQVTTEQRFDLSMSAPITMTSLRDRLGFLSKTEFAMQMLCNEAHIPSNVDTTTTLVLKEIIQLLTHFRMGTSRSCWAQRTLNTTGVGSMRKHHHQYWGFISATRRPQPTPRLLQISLQENYDDSKMQLSPGTLEPQPSSSP